MTRKMVPITGRASSFFEFLFVCMHVNRKEEEGGRQNNNYRATSTECNTLKGERRMIFILLLLTTIRTGESFVLVVKMPCRYLY